MKERGVLFQPDMALATYEGRKTHTRRVVNPMWGAAHAQAWGYQDGSFTYADNDGWHKAFPPTCPYGAAGDRLWVREPWRTYKGFDGLPPRDVPKHALIAYELPAVMHGLGKYRHARFMCRWMSRTLLEIVDVRIERLQNISEADCAAEGVFETGIGTTCAEFGMGQRLYRTLWDSINGEGSWAANPYVWVVVFKKVLNG